MLVRRQSLGWRSLTQPQHFNPARKLLRLDLHTSAQPLPVPKEIFNAWRGKPWVIYPTTFFLLSGAGLYAFDNYQPLRHTVLAVARCSRVARE